MRRVTIALLLLLLTAPGPARGDSEHEALQQRIIEIADHVIPCVVHIEAIVKVNDRRNQVTGSGVIASSDGLILTNQHVVEKAEKAEVVIPGRKGRLRARILGTDKQTDVAVLKVEPDTPLQAATFGSAKSLKVGQWVLAIGNPYGLEGTVSFGIVSAKGRNLEIPHVLNDFIQTDAMIDRGSSGGPLVDLDGRVVGINSRGQGRGIGFTIPIDTALHVSEQIQSGNVERGWLGITMQPLDRDLAEYFGFADATGVVVNSVSQGSPAERAGLRTGDVITRFGGKPVESEKEEDLGNFQRQVASTQPNQRVEVAILRDGKLRRLQVTVGTQPKVEPEEAESDLGFQVQEITEDLYRSQRLPSKQGAFVFFVARGSPAAEAGLSVGDVIERVEGREVEDLDDFREAMGSVAETPRFLVTARRAEETKYLLVKRGALTAPVVGAEDAPKASHGP